MVTFFLTQPSAAVTCWKTPSYHFSLNYERRTSVFIPFFLCSMLPIWYRTNIEGFYLIQVALSAYPADLSQRTLTTTFVQARRILSTSILIQCPSSKSFTSFSTVPPSRKVPPLLLSLTLRKILKIHIPKTKTTSLLVCTCTMKTHKFLLSYIKISTFALATTLEVRGKKNLYPTKYATTKVIKDTCMLAFYSMWYEWYLLGAFF